MEKLNIAEILKDCPKGLELYSPIFGNVYLDEIRPHLAVVVRTPDGQKEEFLYDGRFGVNGECMLFPSRANRNWSTFQRPFKDGDVVFYSNTIAIFKEWGDETLFRTYCTFYTTVSNPAYQFEISRPLNGKGIRREARFATLEEKEKLFDAIKANGYKWNPETKTLEKLGKEKFDITTLKPFDKVLVRDTNEYCWHATFYSHHTGTYFYSTNGLYAQCIPFEENKHLLGTTDDCDEYYKTWE